MEELHAGFKCRFSKGMVEMFDSNIGAGTILMPFGGKYQMTPNDVAVQKISVEKGHSHTASAITWGIILKYLPGLLITVPPMQYWNP